MSTTPLDLKRDATTEPPTGLTLQIISNAVKLNAGAILLELDVEQHLKVQEEMKSLLQRVNNKTLTVEQLFFKTWKLPQALSITFLIAGEWSQMPSVNGELFGNITKILLIAAGIPPWTKADISTPLETINPVSKWTLESKDITRQLQLRRIRANQALPN